VLININAVASVTKVSKGGGLQIRLMDSSTVPVSAQSAEAVWRAFMPFVDSQRGGAPDAILSES